jgi:hypothetical protein
MRRDHWRVRNDQLDPATDFAEIVRNLATHEFPWDTIQALSFALFRTYAVPGVGRLLDQTGAFAADTQKRYDDTALLLEPPGLLGFDHPDTRTAIRRINQMHRSYDIPNHEMRYVLSTFVVVPKRWMDAYGKRPFSPHEVAAVVRYYRTLGRHLGISDIPESFEEFAELIDSYEAEHFAFDEGTPRRRRHPRPGLQLLPQTRPACGRRVQQVADGRAAAPRLPVRRPAPCRRTGLSGDASGPWPAAALLPAPAPAEARRGLLLGAQLPGRLRPLPAGHLPRRLPRPARAGGVDVGRHRLE